MDSWPQEVLFSFFNHADLELLGICSQVCVRWFQMSKDNELWRQKCIDLSMPMPKKRDCTKNQLIPTKDGGIVARTRPDGNLINVDSHSDSRIDWRRVYSIKKRWPAMIRCLRCYCAHLSDNSNSNGEKEDLMNFIDRIATAEWLTSRDESDLVRSLFSYRECHWYADVAANINRYSDFEDLYIFFIHLDLSVINRPEFDDALRSPLFLRVFVDLVSPVKSRISLKLLWTVVHFARELVRRGMESGFNLLRTAVSLFLRMGEGVSDVILSPQKLELLRELTVQVVTAFNTWKIEPYMVIDRQRDFFNGTVSKLCDAYVQLRLPLFENFQEVFSQCGILPPKSARDHLTLVFFGNRIKMAVKTWTCVDDWMKSLPSPAGSSNDIILFLYHYKIIEHANLWKTEILCDEPKIQLACDFLLDALGIIETGLQLDLLKQLASNSERKIFVLSKQHEGVLFEMLKEMYYRQSTSTDWKECVGRLIIALNRTTELKTFYLDVLIELRFSPSEDLFLRPPPVQEIIEECEQNPNPEIEQLLIRLLYDASSEGQLNTLPLNSYSLIFNVIGNQRDRYRSKKEDEQRIKSTDEGVNDGAANMEDANNYYDKDSVEYENELWMSEHLLDLLKNLISENKFAEEVLQNITQLLNMVKSKFGDSDITLFLTCLVSGLISKDNVKSETEQKVADEIIEFVIDWLSDVNKSISIELLKDSETFKTLIMRGATTRKDRAELLAELRSKRISLQ